MGIKKGAIQTTIKEVESALEVFYTAAFDCEFVRHGMQVKEMATGVSYSSCVHEDAVGYIHATSRCEPDRCPFGKEMGQ